MAISARLGKVCVVVFLLVSVQWFMFTNAKLPTCNKESAGVRKLYRKASDDDGLLICVKTNGQYVWKFLDGSSTLGEKFNPAKDCSDIVDTAPEAKDGFYWLAIGKHNISKVWCDVHSDGGGFMLIGMTNHPVTWRIPSNDRVVDPMGSPHWSIQFGDINMQEFAIQISTTKDFKDTKAHWSYRLSPGRNLGDLFGVGSGGCTDVHSGIGNVFYVKDIMTETVVSTKFNCSKFGHHVNRNIGWGRMNYCLRNKCPKGYAYLSMLPFRLDSFGSFSYSATFELSGITDDATAFIGCDNEKCCACFGPKGGRGHYCGRKCTAVNGGTILTSQVYVWFWIRTRMPKRLWRRCMEFKMKTDSGKFETYFIDKNTGTGHKGSCSEQSQVSLNEGTLTVKNKESLENLPSVPGLLSYRKDNKRLYVNKGSTWDAIGSEEETKNLTAQVQHLQEKLQKKNSHQDARVQTLETNLQNKNSQQDARIQTLETKLLNKHFQQDTRIPTLETNLQKTSYQKDARVQNLKTNITKRLENLEDLLKERLEKIEKRLDVIPPRSCKAILMRSVSAVSGIYEIYPKANNLFKVYCDMETHGGGWTLVYSYTFTNYNNFTSGSNAVTPRPNWPTSTAKVPTSTTPPLNESSRGAVDYSLWKEIGQDIMIKSNINDWIVCKPNRGSLVTKTSGGMSCQNIKNVATACHGVAPKRVFWYRHGPLLSASSYYYDFDEHTSSYFPAHDPCGKGNANHKKGVSNPGGQIYLR